MSAIHSIASYHCYGGGSLGEWIAFTKVDLSTLTLASWAITLFYGSDFAIMLGLVCMYAVQISAFLISTVTSDPRPDILLLPCRDESYGLPDYTVVATFATVAYIAGFLFMKDAPRSSWYAVPFIAYAAVFPFETWFNGYTNGYQTFFSIGMALTWVSPIILVSHMIFIPLDSIVPYFPVFGWLNINNSLMRKIKHKE